MKEIRRVTDEEYVFVVTSAGAIPDGTPSPNSSIGSVEEAPTSLPFLPLDASTEITKHEGYDEAVLTAQRFLDSRLGSFSHFLDMVPVEDTCERSLVSPHLGRKIVLTAPAPPFSHSSDSSYNVPPPSRAWSISKGWKGVKDVDESSRCLLRDLEEEGILYVPHDTAYSVKYFAPVAPFGDCLFLSMEQLLLNTPGCSRLSTTEIRRIAVNAFMNHYDSCSNAERLKIDTTIKNLYYPDLSKGWGISSIQTRRFIARRDRKDELIARIYSLEDPRRNISWERRAETVYSEYAIKVDNAKSFASYMLVGSQNSEHFLVSMSYSCTGLVSVDDDQNNNRVAWGDDIVLEALAAAFERDIFVVLVGGGKMFFLPHRPRYSLKPLSTNAPWFLLMRSTGADRGGDHYEPMMAQPLHGDACMALGSIGE